MNDLDTIAAIATPSGDGGIGIIRVSGPKAFIITDQIFKSYDGLSCSTREHGRFNFGKIINSNRDTVDHAIVLIMRNPHSFTGDDTSEIQLHGGIIILKEVLSMILNLGARLAENGEFSKRAFINGKIDLTQAEAICDLISAKSKRAAQIAVNQLEGDLSNEINYIYNLFLEITANLETTIDFIEDELPDDVFTGIQKKFFECEDKLINLIKTWDEGKILREGLTISIIGKPNAGKSTLFNKLLGFDRAIVSEIKGTTRDTLEEGYILNGYPIKLVDTAGLRDTECLIEVEGIKRTEKMLEKSDFVIYIIDASVDMDSSEIVRINNFPSDKYLVLSNKIDKGKMVNIKNSVDISLLDDKSNQVVKDELRKIIEKNLNLNFSNALVSERHKNLLEQTIIEVNQVKKLFSQNIESQAVIICNHLGIILNILGQITGKVYHDELLENIFSRFCIGK